MKTSQCRSYDDLPLFLNADLLSQVLGVSVSTARDGRRQNGCLLYTILPIQTAIEQYCDRQLQAAELDRERRKSCAMLPTCDRLWTAVWMLWGRAGPSSPKGIRTDLGRFQVITGDERKSRRKPRRFCCAGAVTTTRGAGGFGDGG